MYQALIIIPFIHTVNFYSFFSLSKQFYPNFELTVKRGKVSHSGTGRNLPQGVGLSLMSGHPLGQVSSVTRLVLRTSFTLCLPCDSALLSSICRL